MTHALILGGTKGLGRSLAIGALARGLVPIVVGRTADEAARDPALQGAEFCSADLTRSEDASLKIINACNGKRISHFFWVAGIRLKGGFCEHGMSSIHRMYDVHLFGAMGVLQSFTSLQVVRRQLGAAAHFHLTVISSISAFAVQKGSSIYCSIMAGKSQFAACFAPELAELLPGSKTTLIEPGRMRTDFFKGSDRDTSRYMDPMLVAEGIWSAVIQQQGVFQELIVRKNPDLTPRFEIGPQLPERPIY